MRRPNIPEKSFSPPFAETYCLVLGLVFCLALTLFEYFHLQTTSIWFKLPFAVNAKQSFIELYPSTLIVIEHRSISRETLYWIWGHGNNISLDYLAEVLPAKLAHTRGRVYVASGADVPFGDVTKVLAMCGKAGAKSIKLLVEKGSRDQ